MPRARLAALTPGICVVLLGAALFRKLAMAAAFGLPPFISERVASLVAQMTLEEKAGQLTVLADISRPFAPEVNPVANRRDPEGLREEVRKGRVGTLFNGVGVKPGADMQRVAVEETRLKIPLLYGSDIIHGMFTVFPLPLAEASSFEPALAERTARATAVEATATGNHWTFAPMVDVARDQRWGRVAESSGEDTFLGLEMGKARVRGFHGSQGLSSPDSLLACPKHFAAYGAATAGLDYAGAEISEAALRDIHFPPFKASFDAGALTVMSAFNDVAGVPATGNKWLQTDVLRKEWGFEGFVVSDYRADWELIAHGYAKDERDAALKALVAGVDMSMQSGLYVKYLADLVESGDVPMEIVDVGVARVLHVKEKLGLFENPYRCLDPDHEASLREKFQEEHTALARDAARRSMVLLKNEGQVLPLKKAGQRIALVGPYGTDKQNIEGCWTLFGDADKYVPIDAGIKEAMADAALLSIVQGCSFDAPLEGGIEAAVKAAKEADVVVLAVGEPQDWSGEAQSRTLIVLPPAQQALAEAVVGTGKPVVVLLKCGRALALEGAVRDANSILLAWFLGSQTGTAVADVLFGDYNPSGRLPVSFPLSPGQQPFFYNRPRTGRPTREGHLRAYKAVWREVDNEPLFAFGHGLSYTSFSYGAVTLSSKQLAWDGSLSVSAEVRNTGAVAGEEVVQLYVHDLVASRVRPIRELKGFRKLRLDPGQAETVSFELTRHDLAFHGPDSVLRSEPGEFHVWIAPSCVAGEAWTFELLPPAK